MIENWNPNDDSNKEIVSALYRDINDQVEEMIEDLSCPRSFAEEFLRSIPSISAPKAPDNSFASIH